MLSEYLRFIFISALFLTFVFFVLKIFLKLPLDKDKIALLIAFGALLVSLYGAFRGEISGFNLKVYAKDFVIPSTPTNKLSPIDDREVIRFAMTIDFANEGYRQGFIDNL